MDMDAKSQRDALLLMYALARKGIEEPSRAPETLRRIVSVFESNFMEGGKGNGDDA